MSMLTDAQMHELFLKGQEQLAREQAEFEAREEERIANIVYHMGREETLLEKLNRANQASANKWTNDEIELTQDERHGLSWEAFNALRPEVRLNFYNAAKYAREQAEKQKP